MSASQKIQEPVTDGGVQTKSGQFVSEFVGDDRIKGRGLVNKEHPDLGVFVFQVGGGIVEDSSYSV